MIVESAIAKAAQAGLSAAVKGTVCSISKKAIEQGTKEALNKAFPRALGQALSNSGPVERAIAALELSNQEFVDLDEFIASPAFEGFVRGAGLLAVAEPDAMENQVGALSALLQRVFEDKPTGAIDFLASEIVEYVRTAAPDAWQAAVDLGLLGQAWVTETMIQNAVADEITNARNQLEKQLSIEAISFREITNFTTRYKRRIREGTAFLKPQSLNDSPSVPIERLFVEPYVTLSAVSGEVTCHCVMLIASSRRSVLLGNPGGGKSTLAGKLCNDICSDSLDRSAYDVPTAAALIILRDYAQYRKQNPCSIVEYLELQSRSELQIEPPPGVFQALLLTGRLLVVFDGLDELIEIVDRSAVCTAVEHFASEFPVAPILVTSREVGYEQAPLNYTRFSHFKLGPFGNDQVSEYATKWFRHSTYPKTEEGKKLSTGFVVESSIVPDIRSNPLMLSLLCNLYRQDGFIPKNRPDIYQRCADLLFTKWDRGRGINMKLPLEHRLRPAMSFLAHWIYRDDQLQAGVTEEQLVAETARYLGQWVEDDAEAEQIAREFVSFFRGRAWVFTDTGSTKTQRLYQFTHRTFLEYFTADELVRTYSTPKDLHDHLIPKVKSRSWDVVCQLAFQLIAERTGSHNLLTEMLCEDARKTDFLERLNILSFLSRTMDLLYPMPSARRKAVRLCIETVCANVPKIQANDKRDVALEIMYGVLGASEEALKINSSEVESVFVEVVSSEHLDQASRTEAILICYELSALYRGPNGQSGTSLEHQEIWTQVEASLVNRLAHHMKTLANSEFKVGIQSWWRGQMSARELISIHGSFAVFVSVRSNLESWYRWSISSALIQWCLDSEFQQDGTAARNAWRDRMFSEARSIRDSLLKRGPWSRGIPPTTPSTSFHGSPHILRRGTTRWPADDELAETILILLAIMGEISGEVMPSVVGADETSAQHSLVSFYRSRQDPKSRPKAHCVVDDHCKSEQVKEALHQWIEDTSSLIKS